MKIIVLNLETFLILQNDQIIFNMKTKYHKKLAKKQTTCVMNGQSKKKWNLRTKGLLALSYTPKVGIKMCVDKNINAFVINSQDVHIGICELHFHLYETIRAV